MSAAPNRWWPADLQLCFLCNLYCQGQSFKDLRLCEQSFKDLRLCEQSFKDLRLCEQSVLLINHSNKRKNMLL